MRAIVVLLMTALLVGCAGLSKDECLSADWRIIGFEDGAQGHGAARIGEHRRACAKHGISPDQSAYDAGYRDGIHTYCSFSLGNNAGASGRQRLQVCPDDSQFHAGYDQGLKNFCTYDSGYDYGLAGNSYQRVCPLEAEVSFLDGYEYGRHIFSLKSERFGLEDQLNQVIAQQDQADKDEDMLKAKLITNQDLSAEDRAQILLDLKALDDLSDDLEDEEDSLHARIASVEAKLKEMGVEL